MSRQLLLVPSLSCPASCSYCFGPHEGRPIMSRETVEAIVRWQNSLDRLLEEGLDITFHGGEPLVAGVEFYRQAFPVLRNELGARRVKLSIQSNLWLLTDELCEIFREYGVSLGTSLDGPEEINDAQRGQGYFRRTMAGIERARKHGLNLGCICTFTRQSAPQAREIFDFFVREGLSFTVHAAHPSLRYPHANDFALDTEAHGQLLVEMLDRYVLNLDRLRISTLDSLCRSVSAGRGGICTFGDCLGGYLAVGPRGDIYPCQRFAGMAEYEMGNVHNCPSFESLQASTVWRAFKGRQDRIEAECGDCQHLGYCRGGCPYNTLAANGGSFDSTLRDPDCPAYRRIFSHIVDRAMEEVFSEENIEAVVSSPQPEAGLLRRGPLISLMRDAPHPYETAQHASQTLAAVALAATNSPTEASCRLQAVGLVTHHERSEATLQVLHRRLATPTSGLNNLYLHVTFACPLRCAHCYAVAGPERKGTMAVDSIVRARQEAARLGFRHVVITGGEPMAHPQRDALLDALEKLRRKDAREVRPTLTVLRTSLALPLNSDLLRRIACSTDEVVVSVDGDKCTHDARRGDGSYDRTVGNLRALVQMGLHTDLSLATVLPIGLATGAPGNSVRALAKELGIRRTRFRPLLPLGRAGESPLDIVPEALWGHVDPRDMVEYGFSPVASCGIGQNLYVEPDGSAYPCYAWHGEAWLLGKIDGAAGLEAVVTSPGFQGLRGHTVNTNRQCQICCLRYLCGGSCRAWNRQSEHQQRDLDAAPADCSPLHARARSLLVGALEHLRIDRERWLSAGLPLPESPPVAKK